MNKKDFAGFYDIRAGKELLEKTKKKLATEISASSDPKPHRSLKPKKKLAVIAGPALAFILLCSLVFPNLFSNRSSANAQDLMAGIRAQNVDVNGAVTDSFLHSAQNFSIALFQHLAQNDKNKNTLISPLSVALALGMTANGANGDTLNAFQAVLGKYDMNLTDLDRAFKAYSDQLRGKKGNTSITLANSIWYRQGFKANPTFLQTNADYFAAAAESLDFNDKASPAVINRWVKQNTNGKIDGIVDKIEPDTVMYLINALYFNAKWEKPFGTETKTMKGDFQLENGGTAKAMFMYLDGQVDYIKGENESAVLLPYDDGRFAFLAILPKEGVSLDDYIQTLNDQTLSALMDKKQATGMSVVLPRFKTTGDFTLNDALKEMGLEPAFAPGKADFAKMGMGTEGDGLYISKVRHKTFLQVDELGTEAGAVTSVEMLTKAASLNVLNFDRPFVYAVIDTQTGLPLFLGALANPQEP